MKGKVALFIAAIVALSLLTTMGYGKMEKSIFTSSYNESIPLGSRPGWSDDAMMSGRASTDSAIAIDGNNLYVAYDRLEGSDFPIYFKKSSNGGMTWSDEQLLSSLSGWYDTPRIAVNGSKIHVVYGGGEVFYINSTDGGDTWNNRVIISESDGEISQQPDIAIEADNIFVVWEDYQGILPEVYYANSSNGGVSWSTPINLTANDGSTSGAPKIHVNNSKIHIIWHDRRYASVSEIFYLSSTDGGDTWNLEKNITSIDGFHSTGPYFDVWGTNIHLVWWDSRFGHTEIMYKNSTDNGVTWNDPILLSGDDTYRSESPDISVLDNEIHVIWTDMRDQYDYPTASELYYVNSTDGGIVWTSPLRLTTALNGSGRPHIDIDGVNTHVVWSDNRTGNSLEYRMYYKRYPDFPPDPTYNISLNEGWNLISLPLEQSDESIDQVLSSISGKWDYIRTYDPLSPEPWKSNSTYMPDQLNDFSTLNHKQGFWINITESNVNLTIAGFEAISTSITLYDGWNLVGYPTLNNSMTVANALFGTTADKVMVCDTLEPYHIKEVGPTYVMKPGEGYWVHVVADSTWIVNW